MINNPSDLKNNDPETYRKFGLILKQFGLVIGTIPLYRHEHEINHPLIESQIQGLFNLLQDFFQTQKELVIEESKGQLLLNSTPFSSTSTVLTTMLDYLLKLKVGSIKIYPSVTFNELKKFFSLFTYSTHLVGTREEVRNLLTLCKSKNIRITQAEYVKVSEKETVVSRKDYTFKLKAQGEPLRVDETKKLLTYLKRGTLHFKKKELKEFDQIIRDPQNLSAVLFYSAAKIQELKLLQNVGSWEDLIITYLWLVSEYLTRKIQAGKPFKEEITFLEDFKKTLDTRIEKNSLPIKEEGRQKIEKTYTEIKNKLTIEGLLIQFIKEKERLEEIEAKLLQAINSIDSQSLLYRAILQRIKTIGLPAEKIFKLVDKIYATRHFS